MGILKIASFFHHPLKEGDRVKYQQRFYGRPGRSSLQDSAHRLISSKSVKEYGCYASGRDRYGYGPLEPEHCYYDQKNYEQFKYIHQLSSNNKL